MAVSVTTSGDDAAGAQPTNLRQLATVYGPSTWDVYDKLDRSLDPAGPDELIDLAGTLVDPGSIVLDAGCRDGAHLIELVRRYSVRGIGVEPVPLQVRRARAAVDAAGLADRITIHQAGMQSMPIGTDSIDMVWCRDVFEQVDDPAAALAGLVRVLKSGGPLLLYTTVVTDRLRDDERALLDGHMGNIDRNLDRSWLEEQFVAAGLSIESVRSIGTEWREYSEERHQTVSTALLRLARLRRRSSEIVNDHGADIYRHIEANLHWELFQFLGKLDPLIYILRHAPST
ncbi:MAG: class I SAM-dependent methyltransferase [Actinomycetota bacterium]